MWSPHENIARASCDTCLMSHLGSIIRWWHSFPYLAKGQIKFRWKQLSSETQKLLWKHAYFVQFCLRIPKMAFILTYDNKKCQKLFFKKVTSSPFPGFWAIAQHKIKILAWNLARWLLVYSPILYMDNLNNALVGICFLKNQYSDFPG